MKESFVYDEAPRLVAWAEERIPGGKFRDDAKAIGYERDDELVAVVVYDTFAVGSCFVHLAAGRRHWFSQSFAIVAMSHPFVQWGHSRINSVVSANNRLSRIFTRQFGWTEEGRLREAGLDGEDLIVFGMLRHECRYLPLSLGGAGHFGGSTV